MCASIAPRSRLMPPSVHSLLQSSAAGTAARLGKLHQAAARGFDEGEERRHRRLREAHDDEGEEADQDCHGDARRSQRFDELDKTIHLGIPSAGRPAAMARFGG
jgi:hypothetical protein